MSVNLYERLSLSNDATAAEIKAERAILPRATVRRDFLLHRWERMPSIAAAVAAGTVARTAPLCTATAQTDSVSSNLAVQSCRRSA